MCISVVLVRGLVAELERRGVDASDLLLRSQIDPARLLDIRQLLTAVEADQLVREALELTRDQALGLAIAENAPATMLQLFSHLVSAQPTLRHAIATLHRFSGLLVEGATWSLHEDAELATLSCLPPTVGDATRCFMEVALVMARRLGLHFLPSGSALHAVHMAHDTPAYAARYQQTFGCPVWCAQSHYAVVFQRSYLDVVQHHADPTLAASLEAFALRLLQERSHASTVSDRVRALLGYEQEWAAIDTKRIARRLGLSARALRRRLAADGVSMSSLLEEARCRLARAELSRPDATIKETAERLGFSEPSAFHRAFKRWTGLTPSQFRKQDRSRTPDAVVIDAAAASSAERRPVTLTRSVERRT